MFTHMATNLLRATKVCLRRNLEEAARMGYTFNCGPELEFFVFKRMKTAVPPLNLLIMEGILTWHQAMQQRISEGR